MQVDPVTWSDELAEEAKSWADYLAENNKFEHAPNLQAGENLYRSGKPPPTEPCTEATKLFYGEFKNYDFNRPGFSGNTGHFTQVNSLLGVLCQLSLCKFQLSSTWAKEYFIPATYFKRLF